MKTSARLTAIGISFLATLITAQAQLVHWSFSGTASWGDPGDNWFAPGELVFGETPVWIDLSFNPALTAPPRHPENHSRIFLPEDDPAGPDGYTFRVRFGSIDLTRPISLLEVVDNGSFGFESFGDGHELDFQIFPGPTTPDLPLPTSVPANVTGHAGIVLFEHLPRDPPVDYGYLIVTIGPATITPVPEPATYGLLGAAVVGGVVLMRRRRGSRPVLPPG